MSIASTVPQDVAQQLLGPTRDFSTTTTVAPHGEIPDARVTIEAKRDTFAEELSQNIAKLGIEIENIEAEARASNDDRRIEQLQERAEDLHTFCEIFQKDLDALHGHLKEKASSASLDETSLRSLEKTNEKIRSLPATLGQMAAKLNAAAVEILGITSSWVHIDEDPHVPLVGAVASPKTLPAEKGGFIEKGFIQLADASFRVRRIRADGNCLLRAVLVHLLDDLPFLKTLLASVKSGTLAPLSDKVVFAPLEASIADLESGRTTKEDLIGDRQKSLLWIELLRRLCVNWWKARPADELSTLAVAIRNDFADIQGTDDEVLKVYFDRMASARRVHPVYGGQAEMRALQEILKRPVIAVDARVIGMGQQKVPERLEPGALALSMRSNHFDVLLPPVKTD